MPHTSQTGFLAFLCLVYSITQIWDVEIKQCGDIVTGDNFILYVLN